MCIRDRYTPRTGAQGVWAPDFFSLYLRVRNPRLERPGARHPSTLTLRLLRSMRLDERRPGRPLGRWYNPTSGPLAQLVEQGTFNPKVTGSIPVRPTTRLPCLLYTSDAADDLTRVDLGGRRIIKKK